MNEKQQHRMAAVGTDKELNDLLDFSAVRERAECGLGALGGIGGVRITSFRVEEEEGTATGLVIGGGWGNEDHQL